MKILRVKRIKQEEREKTSEKSTEKFENFWKKKKKRKICFFFVTFPNKPGFFRTSGRENYDQRTKRYQTHCRRGR